ncbi:MAG: hypothetical protein CML60_10645 [Rhodobacteraceae bacterium]|nr:hypothetical protein [Paracoccaceae bacterium]
MATQRQKAEQMKVLHEGDETFLIPGPWDVGSAKVFESLGYKALATTSGGLAWAAYGVLIDGAREMKESGTFNWMKSINTDNTIDNLLKPS